MSPRHGKRTSANFFPRREAAKPTGRQESAECKQVLQSLGGVRRDGRNVTLDFVWEKWERALDTSTEFAKRL